MKILVVTKRQYIHKDLLDDQYGRLWEIPQLLSQAGHQIKGICLSYRHRTKVTIPDGSATDPVAWNSYNIFPDFFSYIINLHRTIRQFKPDVMWFSSDCLHIVLGYFLGKLNQIPCVLDLYDNYEFFKLSSIPGIKRAYRYSVKNADAISCISKPLKNKIEHSYQATGRVKVIENAVDLQHFFSHSQTSCRKHFGLPDDIKLIGTAGALHSDRGIENLYDAFKILANNNDRLHLVLAGEGNREHSVFQLNNVHDLGVLSYDKIPLFYSMLDVAIICNINNDFGRYCYPQKAHEILACKTPLIAADVGVMSELLKNHQECLFNPHKPDDLAEKIIHQLKSVTEIRIPVNTWKEQAVKLEKLICKLLENEKAVSST